MLQSKLKGAFQEMSHCEYEMIKEIRDLAQSLYRGLTGVGRK